MALSIIIGENSFLLGNEPCEDDAAVFGLLAIALYASPGAPFHETFKSRLKYGNGENIQLMYCKFGCSKLSSCFSECPNLVKYTERMKEKFWPDWDKLLNIENIH